MYMYSVTRPNSPKFFSSHFSPFYPTLYYSSFLGSIWYNADANAAVSVSDDSIGGGILKTGNITFWKAGGAKVSDKSGKFLM